MFTLLLIEMEIEMKIFTISLFLFGHRVSVVLMHHHLFRLKRERLMERGKFNLFGISIDDGT